MQRRRAQQPAAAAPTPETRKLEENYAEIGQEFCERILKLEPDYCWNESPLEFLTDIINQRDEAKLQAGERLEYPNLRTKLEIAERQRDQARAVAGELIDIAIHQRDHLGWGPSERLAELRRLLEGK